jgi:hypothetical protein
MADPSFPKGSEMRFQVEGFGIVQESRCMSLKEARGVRDALVKRGCKDAQIARYDTSDHSDYYEIVE